MERGRERGSDAVEAEGLMDGGRAWLWWSGGDEGGSAVHP